jgi:hypothetical protein
MDNRSAVPRGTLGPGCGFHGQFIKVEQRAILSGSMRRASRELREKTQGDYAIWFDVANSREFGNYEFALLYVNDATTAAECI